MGLAGRTETNVGRQPQALLQPAKPARLMARILRRWAGRVVNTGCEASRQKMQTRSKREKIGIMSGILARSGKYDSVKLEAMRESGPRRDSPSSASVGPRSPAGAGVCPQGEHVRGGKPGHTYPQPPRWGVPPHERVREEPAGLGRGDRRSRGTVRTAPMARGVIEFPTSSTRAGHGDCRVEIFGGLSMECAMHLYDRLKEVRGGVFPGTEDGADE